MKLINGIIWLEFRELVNAGVNDNTLKRAKIDRAACWDFMNDPDDKRKVLIKFDTLKDRYKMMVVAKFGEPSRYIASEIIKPYLVSKDEDTYMITNYTYGDGKYLADEYRSQCIEACKYLHLMDRTTVAQAKRWFGYNDKQSFNESLLTLIKSDNVRLPKTERTLLNKLKEYRSIGAMSVIDERVGNANARKVGKDEIQMAFLQELRRKHNNLNFEQITELYNIAAQASGWQKVTSKTVENNLKTGRMNLVTYAGRMGKRNLDTHLMPHNKRQKPTAPLFFLSIDGWDVELAYQQREMVSRGGKKVEITTYDNRLVMVVVLDAFNKYPLGYAIGERENVELIKQAMRNAITHVREITGEYFKPWQLQSDHYGIKQLTDFYTNLTKSFTPAEVGNAKSKPIEPYFKHLNTSFCQYQRNWTGFGLQARKENQVNREYTNLIKKDFPTKWECIEQIRLMIELERKNKQSEWVSAFKQLSNADKMTLSRVEYLQLLGKPTAKNTINGFGLTPTINGVKMAFDTLTDDTFRHLNHLQWTVLYDDNDLSNVLAVAHKGQYQYLLDNKHEVSMALKDRKEGDGQALTALKEQKSRILDYISSEAVRANNLVTEWVHDHLQQIRDTKLKLMLTDSKGQQKDPMQDAKRKALPEPVEYAELEPVKQQTAKQKSLDMI
ncbi:MAG: hypothetical protein U0T77_10570 [Chitinophagales bacterium]